MKSSSEVYELFLFATNDGNLYRQKITPIITNLLKKIAKGVYDPALALKLWRYAADDAAQRYTKEFGGSGNSSYGIFTVAMRKEVAALLQDYYNEEVLYTERKENPVKESSAPEKITYYETYPAWRRAVSCLGGVIYGDKDIAGARRWESEGYGYYAEWDGAKGEIERVASELKKNPDPKSRLRHHVTGAIERGEKQVIVGIEAPAADKLALHLDAGNDTNGNPRRIYIVVSTKGSVISAHDEGYYGDAAVTKRYPNIAIVGRFKITPGEYRSLKKQYGK